MNAPSTTNVSADPLPESATSFVEAVRSGEPWFDALLQGIADWTLAEETRNGRHYSYLISGEAFNMLLLAERLLDEVAELVPQEDRETLLFQGRAPREIDAATLRETIGAVKHGAHLNYWYGVVVEQSLQQTVLDEVVKARQNLGSREEELEDETFRRLYNAPEEKLLKDFRKITNGGKSSAQSPLKEQDMFTYWLFKRRVARSDPARLASDTMKGLRKLERLNIPKWHWASVEP
jgi:hypothetical protein